MNWHRALAWALTGEMLALPAESPDVPRLLAELAAAGWPQNRIVEHANEVASSGGVWPHPIPQGLRAGLGAAQLAANLLVARQACNLLVLEVRPPSRRATLDADERRLMDEVPPHY